MDTASLNYSSACFYNAIINKSHFYSPKVETLEAEEILIQLHNSPDAKLFADFKLEPVKGYFDNEHYTTLDLIPLIGNLDNQKKIFGIYGKEDGLFDDTHLDLCAA